MGDEYGGGVVAIADSVSGELVIVPSGVADDLEIIQWADDDAKEFCESYEKNGYSDYRLITKAEAVAILGNSALVSQLGLPTDNSYWTIEEDNGEEGKSYGYDVMLSQVDSYPQSDSYYALPVRKVNFYGLPLIESEFGGGLVYDVVAATREVKIIPHWGDVIYNYTYDWDTAIHKYTSGIGEVYFMALPTRAQALKIFGNSYLVSLAGLPLDGDYWTSEEVDLTYAYAYVVETEIIEALDKGVFNYVLPVRSETV